MPSQCFSLHVMTMLLTVLSAWPAPVYRVYGRAIVCLHKVAARAIELAGNFTACV